MNCTVPVVLLRKSTFPSDPTFTTTRFGIVSPAEKFRFDTVGAVTPSGYTSAFPPTVGAVTVTFSTTAVTPDDGTPSTPATASTADEFAATGPVTPPVPLRVSSTRTGLTGVNNDPLPAAARAWTSRPARARTGAAHACAVALVALVAVTQGTYTAPGFSRGSSTEDARAEVATRVRPGASVTVYPVILAPRAAAGDQETRTRPGPPARTDTRPGAPGVPAGISRPTAAGPRPAALRAATVKV